MLVISGPNLRGGDCRAQTRAKGAFVATVKSVDLFYSLYDMTFFIVFSVHCSGAAY